MAIEELEKLKSAFYSVFDENDKIKECGRDACIRLIHLMEKYTPKNVGNEDTGMIEIDAMKLEYYRVIATL